MFRTRIRIVMAVVGFVWGAVSSLALTLFGTKASSTAGALAGLPATILDLFYEGPRGGTISSFEVTLIFFVEGLIGAAIGFVIGVAIEKAALSLFKPNGLPPKE